MSNDPRDAVVQAALEVCDLWLARTPALDFAGSLLFLKLQSALAALPAPPGISPCVAPAAPAAGMVEQWRPIETAPRVKLVIVWGPVIGGVGHRQGIGMYCQAWGGWWTHSINGLMKACGIEPLLWQPMPVNPGTASVPLPVVAEIAGRVERTP